MEAHFNLNNDEFEQRFSNCTLDDTLFSHEAHLRLAWIHLDKYGLEVAILNICDQLLNYVKAVGAEEKFNKTLTCAAVMAVNHFRNKTQARAFNEFIKEFPALKYNFKALIGTHYKIDIYNSIKAKTEFIAPDLEPF